MSSSKKELSGRSFRVIKTIRRGKSGLHRVGWPLTTAPSDRRKVPQKRKRSAFFKEDAGNGEKVR